MQFLSRKTVRRPYTPTLRDSAAQVLAHLSPAGSRGCGVLSGTRRRTGVPLVRTKNGHWTFPKGRVDQDATNADAAAREAFEEAGVRGSVDSVPFSPTGIANPDDWARVDKSPG